VPKKLSNLSSLKVPSTEIYTGASIPPNAKDGAIWFDPNEAAPGLGTSFSGGAWKPSIAQSIPAGGVTNLLFDTEIYDTDNYGLTGNSTINIPETGYYDLMLSVWLNTAVTGLSYLYFTISGSFSNWMGVVDIPVGSGRTYFSTYSLGIPLPVGATVVPAINLTGTNVSVQTNYTVLSIKKVG
jgi:hypothetical protein